MEFCFHISDGSNQNIVMNLSIGIVDMILPMLLDAHGHYQMTTYMYIYVRETRSFDSIHITYFIQFAIIVFRKEKIIRKLHYLTQVNLESKILNCEP